MKVVNLNKFKNAQQVELDGKTYSVRGLKVKEYMSGEFDVLTSEGKTPKENLETMINFLLKVTDIPKEVLEDQELQVLTALVELSNGTYEEGSEKK
jgi:hypothetical protein